MIFNFSGSQEEIETAVSSATDGRLCAYIKECSEYSGNFYYITNRYTTLSIYNCFAALEAVKALGYDLTYEPYFYSITYEIGEVVAFESKTIDLLSEIGGTADDETIYGDLNADSKIIISYAIIMNEAVTGELLNLAMHR